MGRDGAWGHLGGGGGGSELGSKDCPARALFDLISNAIFDTGKWFIFFNPAIQGSSGEERDLVRRRLPAIFDRLGRHTQN
jgi:hypothetical protein